MSKIFGFGDFQYEYVDGWPNVPGQIEFVECPGVAVDSQNKVYLLTRGADPIVIFDKDGHYLNTIGKGMFSESRTHGLYIAHDDSILVADDGLHTIQKISPEGEKLMEIGQRNKPKPIWGGEPFNRPTSAAIRPDNGDIYVSDGYGNSRIHIFNADGDHKLSWGSPGIDAGQFMRPHNIALDGSNNVYVVDREAHRVQIFDEHGTFLRMWNNIHRPDSMVLYGDHVYIGELNGMPGLDTAPGMGHRVGIYNLKGDLVCRFGEEEEGEGPGQFIAPHGIAVDSDGSIYVSEVSYTIRGSHMIPPRYLRSVSKYRRVR